MSIQSISNRAIQSLTINASEIGLSMRRLSSGLRFGSGSTNAVDTVTCACKQYGAIFLYSGTTAFIIDKGG